MRGYSHVDDVDNGEVGTAAGSAQVPLKPDIVRARPGLGALRCRMRRTIRILFKESDFAADGRGREVVLDPREHAMDKLVLEVGAEPQNPGR